MENPLTSASGTSPHPDGLSLLPPESPRQLLSKSRTEDAKATLVKYHTNGNPNKELVNLEFEETQGIMAEKPETKCPRKPWCRLLEIDVESSFLPCSAYFCNGLATALPSTTSSASASASSMLSALVTLANRTSSKDA